MLNIRRALEAKKAARENGEEAGFSLIELIIVVVNAIVRDSPERRIRRAERARRRLDRAVRSAARHGIAPRAATATPRPFSNRVGTVGPVDRSGFVEPGPRPLGPRDWTPGGP
jgi:hypothetical protein